MKATTKHDIEVQAMKIFEIGKTYYSRSICDHNCIFAYTVTARTAKTVTLWDINTETSIGKRKITVLDDEEVIFPKGKYSMAPLVRASSLHSDL